LNTDIKVVSRLGLPPDFLLIFAVFNIYIDTLKIFEEICVKMFDIGDMKYYEVIDTKYKIDIMSQFFD